MKPILNITPVCNWLKDAKRPLIISGPCSAESETQMLTTAKAIAAIDKRIIFRAGIWKPRTRPNAFEGIGSKGLEWMRMVKEQTGLLTATEVANANHVEECLKNNIDILWIGARTTVNPFSVQEIADALKGTDIPVFVKNPVTPDLQLWLGALERINQAGITKLAAIHRGFHSHAITPFRNVHGLMIETHCMPKMALSDAKQQLTPLQLADLIDRLVVRKANSENIEFKNKLEQLSESINKTDEDLLQVLMNRMQMVEKIGVYKKENNVTILQTNRWENLLNERLNSASMMGLCEEFVRSLYLLIHEESIRKQNEVMNF
ncbi:MAG: chorismate mutase [Bacteroidetes bacterium]|nr:chorismate mutase [Bacteroidota bacterium]